MYIDTTGVFSFADHYIKGKFTRREAAILLHHVSPAAQNAQSVNIGVIFLGPEFADERKNIGRLVPTSPAFCRVRHSAGRSDCIYIF